LPGSSRWCATQPRRWPSSSGRSSPRPAMPFRSGPSSPTRAGDAGDSDSVCPGRGVCCGHGRE
jgi:hypothetical protein